MFYLIVNPSDAFAYSGIYSVPVTLHVPATSINAYRTTAPWSDFGTIVAFTDEDDTDDIEDIEHSPLNTEHSEVAIYNLAGRKIVNGQSSIVNAKWPQGINIIRYSDGTSRKVLIK